MDVERRTRVRILTESLGLERHPEGGRFRQIFKSTSGVDTKDGRPTRSAMTSIYYLLSEGEVSRWHRVRSDEIWHFYEGDPLELIVASPDFARVHNHRLEHVGHGGGPVQVVPAHWWQAARSLGAYSLVGCTVAPGFEYDDFAFLSDEPGAREQLELRAPSYRLFL
jgi:predicted cupin superfamily sugar epimerase